jgi:hypothetical protein
MTIEVSDELRAFFDERGIDVDAVLDDGVDGGAVDALLEATASSVEVREVLRLVQQVHSADVRHKLLAGAALLELRSQVKKVQSELAEHRKQHQRDMNKMFDEIREVLDHAKKILGAVAS